NDDGPDGRHRRQPAPDRDEQRPARLRSRPPGHLRSGSGAGRPATPAAPARRADRAGDPGTRPAPDRHPRSRGAPDPTPAPATPAVPADRSAPARTGVLVAGAGLTALLGTRLG